VLNTLDDALYNLELSSLRVYDEHIILRIVDLTNRGAETKVERVGDGDAGKERVDEREKGARVDNSTSKVSVWVRTLITRPVAVPCQRHHTHTHTHTHIHTQTRRIECEQMHIDKQSVKSSRISPSSVPRRMI
jgi:hypothetical protein